MKLAPHTAFCIFTTIGFGLLFTWWLQTVDTGGFFLLLVLGIMCLARYRFNNKYVIKTIFADLLMTMVFFFLLDVSTAPFAIGFVLFQAMYFGFFPVAALLILLVVFMEVLPVLLISSMALVGLVLYLWDKEHANRLQQRDDYSNKIFEMEMLHNELVNTLAKVEHMSIIAERSRISADIHDNAGHEIIASYISMQTVRNLMDKNPAKALELFDKSMSRLNAGIGKMRDAVHNISAVTFMGVDSMRKICQNFEEVPVTFQSTGDVSVVTVNVWHVLESLLNESLTNAVKHARPTYVCVELDATKHIIRLKIQNDGVTKKDAPAGSGLRNLRYRVVTVGGNLTVNKADVFKLVCVIPV
ncbi:MAG: histidine kinase [Defluviitaleaceae bacterium]|nr:histidine kinase [Defluviitaleaceae bacterium]